MSGIITIEKLEADKEKAIAEFSRFMLLAQQCFNEDSAAYPKKYAKKSPFEIEEETVKILDAVKSKTAFYNSKIELKKGHFFPDIIAGNHYGVEVKSTKENKWTSLGNSIFEGVSDKKIDNIFIMFANLGSLPPAFRFRPYQSCLKQIQVTHSPRYIIDMDIADNDGETIFAQMKTDYLKYRDLPNAEKMSLMRAYYLKKANNDHKYEMPWWMGADESNAKLSFFSDATLEQKKEMICRALILFPCLYHDKDKDKNKYKSLALWLCTRYGLLLYNVRDGFTASGQVKCINGVQLDRPYPKIAKTVLDYRPQIYEMLSNPDPELSIDISEMWDFEYDKDDLYLSWIDMVSREFKKNKYLSYIDIRKHLLNEDKAK